MAISTVPAAQGAATFSDLNIVVNLTVANTLSGDIVEIINNATDAILGTATKTPNTNNWRAAILLPADTVSVNISARTKRGTEFSSKATPTFAVTYQAPTP